MRQTAPARRCRSSVSEVAVDVEQMRTSIRRLVQREGPRLRRAAPNVIVAGLIAAAVLPLAMPLVGAGSIGVAAGGLFAILQDYGRGYLSEAVKGAIDRLRADDGAEAPSASAVQAGLEQELLAGFNADDEGAVALREEAGLLLRSIGGVQVALDAAAADVKTALAQGFAELGAAFEEFRWMLGEVRYALIDIRDTQTEQLALQRGQHDLLREQLTKLNLLISMQERHSSVVAMVDHQALTPAGERLPAADVPCPFKGLAAFQPEDAGFFFGREGLVAGLMPRLAETPFLGVVGPSGSGKSSAVRAGLLPAVWKGALPGSRSWKTVVMTPGAHPIEELAVRIPALEGLAAVSLAHDLREDPRALRVAVQRVLLDAPDDARLLLVVDQFEEVFTLCQDEAERRCFIEALLEAVAGGNHTLAILVVRADFYGRCAAYPALADLLQDSHALVGPMGEDELRLVIERSAAWAGMTVEPGLDEVIIHDVADEPGALPLLSHALLETWKRREGRTLTLAGYTDSGGVREAITRTADSVFGQQLDPRQRGIARSIFLRLTELGEATEDTRRRATRTELATSLGNDVDVGAVLDRLIEARLVTTEDETVEVAHEALIREWPTLRHWLNEDREGLRIHRHLTRTAQDWAVRKDPDELYRGARLATAGEWAAEHASELNALEREFLDASIARQRAEQERQERQNRRLRALTAGLSVLLVGAVVSATLAVRQTNQAELQRQRSDSRQLAAQATSNLAHRPGLAMLLSLEAMRTKDTPQARSSLLAGLQHDPRLIGFIPNPDPVSSVAFSPDGQTLAVGDGVGGLSLWDVRSRSRNGDRFRAHTHAVLGLAFSPDGRTLASAGSVDRTAFQLQVGGRLPAAPPLLVHEAKVRSATFDRQARLVAVGGDDGTVALWDLRGRRLLWRRPAGDGSPVLSVAIREDGRLLAAGDRTGAITLFDVAGGVRRRWPAGQSSVTSLAFGPDRRTLISGGRNGAISIWDTRDWTRRQLVGHTGSVVALALSRDRRLLASGGFDNSVMVWDLDRRRRVGPPLLGHTGPVFGIAFGRTSNVLASAGNDGQVILWDLTAGQRLATPLPGSGKVAKVWFRPGGGTIAAGGPDGKVRLWDEQSRTLVDTLLGVSRAPSSMAFHPDARILALGGADGSVRLWDLRGHKPIGAPLHGHDKATTALAFSRDGRRLVSGGGDGTVAVWDVQRWQRIGAIHRHTDNTQVRVTSVALSPDGRTLASGAIDEKIALWDLAIGRRFATLEGFAGPVKSLLFSPRGPVLAAGTDFGSVTLWRDAVAGRVPHAELLGRHSGQVTSLAFNAGGTLLASGGADHKVQLWDVAIRQGLGAPFAGHTGIVRSLSFSQDGRLLASGGEDGNLLLWDLDVGSWQRRVCSIVRRSLSRLEWNAFISGRPYRPTCR
jgi:WD40 repeat protein